MMKDSYLGRDLDLGFVADEEGHVLAGPFTQVDLQAKQREGVSPRAVDLAVVQGRANLVQSLIMRLMTEQGELAGLGHSTYGSRHHRLIGEPNTENNRNLIKLYVLECLRQELRLAAIEKIEVRPGEGRENRDKVAIYITATVRGEHDPLSLIVPFSFSGSV
jgi:hypothetical protein